MAAAEPTIEKAVEILGHGSSPGDPCRLLCALRGHEITDLGLGHFCHLCVKYGAFDVDSIIGDLVDRDHNRYS